VATQTADRAHFRFYTGRARQKTHIRSKRDCPDGKVGTVKCQPPRPLGECRRNRGSIVELAPGRREDFLVLLLSTSLAPTQRQLDSVAGRTCTRNFTSTSRARVIACRSAFPSLSFGLGFRVIPRSAPTLSSSSPAAFRSPSQIAGFAFFKSTKQSGSDPPKNWPRLA
jgi:hypothetical protein